MLKRRLVLAVVSVAICGMSTTASAQRSSDEPMTGARLYREYCTGCHGRTGRGDGAVAPSLKAAPPDLATLSQRNGGSFPRQRVKGAILNVERPVAAHGTGEMPVWAHVFSALGADDAELERRVDALVQFVETLQRSPR